MSELKPLRECPFCGGEARIVEGDYTAWDNGYAVRCDNCALTLGASGRLGEAYAWTCCYDGKAAAVKAWNTRYERTCRMKPAEKGIGLKQWGCSGCGGKTVSDSEPPFCSKCGARVKEG